MMHNKMGAKETQLIEPLADAQPVINSPVLEVGSERYISPSAQFDNSSAVKYSQMTGSLGVTAVGNNGISITTESSSNPKYEFFDFNTKIVVPARTEYTVKYKITYTLYKNATNNTSNIYSSLYDYGKDYHKDSPESYKINAQKLYETNGDFDIGPSGDYFINRIQTNACKSTVSDSYEYTATHTNKSKAEMEFFHNYSCYVFGWKGTGTTKSYSMKATVSVTAEIEAKLLGQASPVDVEVEYTGQSLSLANVEESQKTWYNASLMSIDYSANADMVNAGLKKVKVTITASDEFFKEAPDESIGESDTVRYFNFTITKKKIGVDITEKTGGGGLEVNAKTGAVYAGDTEANKRAPIFAVSYKNNSTGIVYNSYPTDVGTYTATVSISNECNYELDGTYTHPVTVSARKIAKPSVGLTTLPYNGETQDFTVSGMSNDVTITAVTSGLTYSNGKLSAKDFGTYKATVSLADGGKNTEWVGGGTADFEITLNIEKAKLSITFSSDGGWTWNSGVSKTVSITDNRKKDSEVLSFSVSYDGNAISNVTASSTPKQTDIVIPPLSSQSSAYKLSVSLNDSGDGKNYDLIGITTQDFNITDKVIKVEESNIIWSYTNGNETKQLASWDSTSIFEVTYNGKEFEFSAKLSGLDPKDEVIIDGYTTETGEDAGEYTTIVTLKSSVGQLTQSSFTLKWKINKALFDLSNVKWDYDPAKPYEYNDNFHEVKLTGLPEGLSAEYEDNRKMNVGKYTAQVSNLIIAENLKDNYVRPEIGNALTYQCKDENGDDKVVPWKCDWEIKKAVLDLSWVKKTYDDKNSRKIRAYEVSDEFMRGKIEYKYYAESDYVDGVAVGAAVDFSSLTVTPGVELKYYVVAVIKSQYKDQYDVKAGTQYKRFTVGSQAPIRDIKIESKFSYDGKAHGVKEEWQVSNNSHIVAQYYSVGNDGIETLIEGAPINAGKYVIKLDIEDGYEDTFELSEYKFAYEITKAQILAVWNTEGEIPVIENATQVIEYEY
ncbi:MAG: hypothetical protein K2H36_00275, partial [Clostridia bacterium]|nr:hypothetical protein [Clostridia bacterium]